MLCVLAGTAAALFCMPRIVRVSRDDTSRLCALLDAARSRAAPRVILLGNSAGMFGVDTHPLGGWNFCSPAQTFGEGLLLQQELPQSVRVIVQLATPSQLAADFPIEPDHYNAMRLCGYVPRAETRAVIAGVFGDEVAKELDVSPLEARIDGRRHVRAAIEGLARDLLRRDGERLRLARELYFPAPATGMRGGWLPEQRFDDLAGGERFVVHEPQVRLLRESASLAERAGRRYVVVLAPVHPRLQADAIPCPPRLDCVDLTHLLGADKFQDPTHASRAGAAKLTRAIRDALTARRLL